MELRALVIFDSTYGNTAKVAEAVSAGLNRVPGIQSTVVASGAVRPDMLDAARLIAIGGPTEHFSESSRLKKFFERIGAYDLRGKFGFAFDTHGPGPFTGSAAHAIERQMAAFGMIRLEPRQSGITSAAPRNYSGDVLAPGVAAHFEAVGKELGEEFARRAAELSGANGEKTWT